MAQEKKTIRINPLAEGVTMPKPVTGRNGLHCLYVLKDIAVRTGRAILPLGFSVTCPKDFYLSAEALPEDKASGTIEGTNGRYSRRYACEVVGLSFLPTGEACLILDNRDEFSFYLKAGAPIAGLRINRVPDVIVEGF